MSVIRTAVRVAPRDSPEQLRLIGIAWPQVHDGCWIGRCSGQGKRSGRELHVRFESLRPSRLVDVLQRAAKGKMHFPAKGIEAADVAVGVGTDGDFVLRHVESPGLCIMCVGGKSR